MRGSGLHQRIGSSSPNHGKMPRRRRRAAARARDRRRPRAGRSASRSAASTGGNGSAEERETGSRESMNDDRLCIIAFRIHAFVCDSPASRPRRPATCISVTSSTRSTSGVWRGRSADACSCASRITTGSAAVRRSNGAILEDLAWLGFVPDDGLNPVQPAERQRNRVCADALATLQATHHVYACDCSRKEIARLRRLRRDRRERYPGRCRHRRLRPGDECTDGAGIRSSWTNEPERFDDQALGAIEQTPAGAVRRSPPQGSRRQLDVSVRRRRWTT